MKICIVSSCGGHLTEVRALKKAYEKYDHFYVLNDLAILPKDMENKTHFISHSERDWRFFLNLWEACKILRQEKPNLILSTGAGPVVPFTIIARLFFAIHVIFVETLTRVFSPSLTGRIMYRLANQFYFQQKTLEKYFPKGTYGGTLV